MDSGLPDKLDLRVVTPTGELVNQTVDELVAPGAEGYFGVRPGHTPLLATLGIGELSYRTGEQWQSLTCFSGFCEVLPGRVTVLAEIGERAEDIDLGRAEAERDRALTRLRAISAEAEYAEARSSYDRAVTRIGVARRKRDIGPGL